MSFSFNKRNSDHFQNHIRVFVDLFIFQFEKYRSTFIQKFIVLQRGYHHARRLNKMNKIKSNDVQKNNK